MRVLVTDDSEDFRLSTKLVLQLLGHKVEVATNGEEAVEVATKIHPEIVLMDLNMPKMDGFTATRLLRQQASTKDIPVIAISAFVNEASWCDRALAAGCNLCLGKPFDVHELDRLIRQFSVH